MLQGFDRLSRQQLRLMFFHGVSLMLRFYQALYSVACNWEITRA